MSVSHTQFPATACHTTMPTFTVGIPKCRQFITYSSRSHKMAENVAKSMGQKTRATHKTKPNKKKNHCKNPNESRKTRIMLLRHIVLRCNASLLSAWRLFGHIHLFFFFFLVRSFYFFHASFTRIEFLNTKLSSIVIWKTNETKMCSAFFFCCFRLTFSLPVTKTAWTQNEQWIFHNCRDRTFPFSSILYAWCQPKLMTEMFKNVILIGDNWKLSSIMRKNGMWQAYNIDWLPNNYNQWWQIAQKTIFQCADCPPKGLSFLHRQYSLLIGTRYPSSHNVAHNNMSIKIKKNMFHPIINRFTRTHIHT